MGRSGRGRRPSFYRAGWTSCTDETRGGSRAARRAALQASISRTKLGRVRMLKGFCRKASAPASFEWIERSSAELKSTTGIFFKSRSIFRARQASRPGFFPPPAGKAGPDRPSAQPVAQARPPVPGRRSGTAGKDRWRGASPHRRSRLAQRKAWRSASARRGVEAPLSVVPVGQAPIKPAFINLLDQE